MSYSKDDIDYISKKKPSFPINKSLRGYLRAFSREIKLPVSYTDLTRYSNAFPLYNEKGQDTLWESAMYPAEFMQEIHMGLKKIYAILRTDGDLSLLDHLIVDRIDYCTFGNSNPFRIRIVNQFNDNYDYYYIKKADASRIYGLELEHILSPNRIHFFVDQNTLVEDHIAGIPGDTFIQHYLQRKRTNKVRIAKEFVKFNERCFVRLLGDMRSYNYVIDITPDFDNEQYRIRSIDFDQQTYEGKRTLYLPQYFKENNKVVEFCRTLLDANTIKQYQLEEQTLIGKRLASSTVKYEKLMTVMKNDKISSSEKTKKLASDLSKYHKEARFLSLDSMGKILDMHLKKIVS